MSLGRRLAKLEATMDRAGAGAFGVLHEGTEDAPDAVAVGDARMSVAEFSRRYPRGLLLVLADYTSPQDDPPAAGPDDTPR